MAWTCVACGDDYPAAPLRAELTDIPDTIDRKRDHCDACWSRWLVEQRATAREVLARGGHGEMP